MPGESKGGPSVAGTTTTNVQPWSGQQPYLLGGFAQAANLGNNYTPQYFPGQQVAGFTDNQNQALGATSAIADQNINGGFDQWMNAFDRNLGGGTLVNSNPTLNDFENFGYNGSNVGYNGLTPLAQSNPLSGHVVNDLSGVASGNPLNGNAVNSLTGLSQGNPLSGNVVNDLSGVASGNPLSGFVANDLAGTASGNPLSGYVVNDLSRTASGNPLNGNVVNSLSGQMNGNIAAENPAYGSLAGFASGQYTGANNPYTNAVASSVLSSVVPSIEAQFINGGDLSSPEAARATAEGATAALAPVLFNQYTTEQQLQQSGANSLENALLQGGALQQGAAGTLGSLGLQGSGLSTQAAQALGSLGLQGTGLSTEAAQALGSLGLQGTGLSTQAAQALGSLGLQGSGLTEQAAQALGSLGLQGTGLQTTAAGTLGSLGLQGSGLSEQAAQALLSGGLTAEQGASQGYESGMTNAIQGMLAAPSVQGLQYNDINNLFGAGAAQQNQAQNEINAAMNQWNYNQTLPYQQLNEYLSEVGGTGYGSSTTNPYLTNPTQNTLGTLGGIASLGTTLFGGGNGAGLIGALSSFFSDRRLKDDIEQVGQLDTGLPVYSYRYLWDDPETRWLGLMADDVEEKHPEAVVTIPGFFGSLAGVKAVDYARAVE